MLPDRIAEALADAEARGIATSLKAAKFFDAVWKLWIDSDSSLDGADIQAVLENSGLVVSRPCTAEEAVGDMCEGDDATFLTDDGKALVAAARAAGGEGVGNG
jgi:hypothetical protein